jgi:hypothetical protein
MVQIPVEALFKPCAEVEIVPPVMLPVTFTDPVLELLMPYMPVAVPPVTLPVKLIVPPPVLETAGPSDPVAFPVIVTDPNVPCESPDAVEKLPPTIAPVTDNAPVPVFATAFAFATLPPVNVPAMLAVAGEAAAKVKQLTVDVTLLCVTFAVKVTPLLST